MKRFMNVLFVLSMFVGMGTQGAQAAEHTSQQTRGLFAQALFRSVDADGCVVRNVVISPLDGRVKINNTQPDAQSAVVLLVDTYDQCTQTLLSIARAEASLADVAFEMDQQLRGATLRTTLDLVDLDTGTTTKVDVDLQWTGVGEAGRQRDSSRLDVGGFTVIGASDSRFRQATAGGSITTADGINFTPEAATAARLGSLRARTIEITR